jgi:hypothetical protein
MIHITVAQLIEKSEKKHNNIITEKNNVIKEKPFFTDDDYGI